MAQDERAAWIARVLGVSVPTHGATDSTALSSRLASCVPLLKALKEEGAPDMPALLTAAEAAKSGLNSANGAELLDTLEGMIARARSAAEERQAIAANDDGISYPELLLRWRSAQSQAREAVARIGRAVLAMPEVQGDPRFARVQSAVTTLPDLIPDLGGQLADLLEQGIKTGNDAGIAKDALAAVASYRRYLADASALRGLESFARKYVGDLPIYTALAGALAQITESLDAAT